MHRLLSPVNALSALRCGVAFFPPPLPYCSGASTPASWAGVSRNEARSGAEVRENYNKMEEAETKRKMINLQVEATPVQED